MIILCFGVGIIKYVWFVSFRFSGLVESMFYVHNVYFHREICCILMKKSLSRISIKLELFLYKFLISYQYRKLLILCYTTLAI